MTFDPKEARALAKDLLAYDWDYPCVHCGSPVLEANSQGKIICCGCFNENPADARSETICKVDDTLSAALDEIERLRDALEECQREIDDYIRQEYPLDHPVHERYRKRDFSANPARIALKGQDQ